MRPFKLRTRVVVLALMAVIGLAFSWSLHGAYHFDDSHSVEANFAIRQLSNLPEIWKDAATSSIKPENQAYRPMVFTVYALCWKIGNGATWPFHIAKMLIHLAACLAFFLIWRRLWEKVFALPTSLQLRLPFSRSSLQLDASVAAGLLAILFAVHPAISECVIYIAATTSLLCAAFYAWAFYLYLLYREEKKKWQLILGLVLFLMSLMSKEEGITLPAVIVLTELFAARLSWRGKLVAAAKQCFPFVVVAAVGAFILYKMHPPNQHVSRGSVAAFDYFITQWRAYLWYMRLWFWPWDLNADNVVFGFSYSLKDPRVIQAIIGNCLLLIVAFALRRKVPVLLYGLLWFYITIAPASSIVPLAEPVNEHRMYLAYFGFAGGTFSLIVWMWGQLAEKVSFSRDFPIVYLAAFAGLMTGSVQRNQVWMTSRSLWEDTVEKNPTSGRALNNLALTYMREAEYDKALKQLKACEFHWERYPLCPLNVGVVYQAQKKYDLAEVAFLRAQRLLNDSVVNYYLGKLYVEWKPESGHAEPLLQRADSMTGGRYIDAKMSLAELYLKTKDSMKARSALQEILALDPSNAEAQKRLLQIPPQVR